MIDRSYGALQHRLVGRALGFGFVDLLVCLVLSDLAVSSESCYLQ